MVHLLVIFAYSFTIVWCFFLVKSLGAAIFESPGCQVRLAQVDGQCCHLVKLVITDNVVPSGVALIADGDLHVGSAPRSCAHLRAKITV